ncbi:N-acetylglucosamine kinase [Paenibacillus rhizophilus]|nr:BadF/BadG/BcrA/BcrD ATPase family protein [Paenibacillus rhizophilus]
MLIVCVDGGQTKTSIDLFDGNAGLIRNWKTEPVIHYARPGGLDSYFRIAAGLCEELNGMKLAEPVSVCFSLSGYHGDVSIIPETIERGMSGRNFSMAGLLVVPDYWGNWRAVTNGKPGIVVISGGGTVAYGKNAAGSSARLGGWGHHLGDEGSGYWIGLEAVKEVLKARSGISASTALEQPVASMLDFKEESGLLAGFYSGEITDKDLALLVPAVNEQAERGDPAACRIMEEAAGHLFRLAFAALKRLGGELPVYLSGGVFNASTLRRNLSSLFETAGISRLVSICEGNPAHGIYSLARENAAL